ncbi:organic cation/carnitine transporter 7-like isoform X2 [Rhododendron vialii]|uniref:organic cation/carnitine transporter 7-like isoform X2 n=1 Tax=Rhododendron vialii TaxID=182163 RepID=UPI00265E7A84|nr:organic cation/carnitine transporter 7-like isoform X2 [Rhododendron vialii]
MADPSIAYTLDEALSTLGFGRFQGPAVNSEWGLTSSEESLITTVVFAGMIVGAYAWGLVSDTYGRTKSLLGVAIVSAGAGVLSALSPNYIWLVVLRWMVGIGLGGGHVFSSWFLEFVPTANRGTWMIVFSTFWSVGTVLEAVVAWIIMPSLGWRWLLGLSTLPCFALLLFYVLIPETPRYLCNKGRTSEAQAVLEKVATLNGTKLPPGILVSDHLTDGNEEFTLLEDTHLLTSSKKKTKESGTSSSPLVLFSPKLIRTTFLLWIVYFGNTFSYYGIVLLTSELSSEQSTCSSRAVLSGNIQDSSLYINVFITSLAEFPGLVLSAIIVDKVGRKFSMAIMLLLGFVLLLPLVSQQGEILTTASLFGARMFISASFVIACIYAPEVYPTSIRSTGVGVATAIGRIGGMICPLVAVALVSNCHQTAAIILFEVIVVVVGMCVMIFPFETMGRELSDSVPLSNSNVIT